VKPLFSYRATSQLLVAGLLVVPFALAAQTASPTQEADWRRANDAVGVFKRGHADVLKWEQTNVSVAAVTPSSTMGVAIPTAEVAVRMAWMVHRELARPLSKLGPQNEQLIAQGRWTELDPSLQRRVEDAGEVLEVAAAGRKAWIEAVAAQQVLKHQRDMLEAAQAAYELGQRMVTVGNWSKLQHAQVQLAKFKAQAALKKARHTAFTAQARLIKTLQLTGVQTHLNVPLQWPALPERAVSPPEFQQRLTQIHAQLTRVNAIVGRGRAEQAFAAYQTSFELARSAGGEVLGAQTLIHEETVLHYNGMLKSTWELLATAQNLHQARVDAITALRDFELAQIDLQWVLLGGEPDALVTWNAAASEAASTAGH